MGTGSWRTFRNVEGSALEVVSSFAANASAILVVLLKAAEAVGRMVTSALTEFATTPMGLATLCGVLAAVGLGLTCWYLRRLQLRRQLDKPTAEERVRSYRSDIMSRVSDKISDVVAAISRGVARNAVRSSVLRTGLLILHAVFIADYVLDSLVGKVLIDNGSVILGVSVLLVVASPYLIMVLALSRTVPQLMVDASALSLTSATLLWLLGGVPAMVMGDIYLTVRYPCSYPTRVPVFHYTTLRGLSQLPAAQVQLLLQGWACLLRWVAAHDAEGMKVVGGASAISPFLLGASMAFSGVTVCVNYRRLQQFSRNQTGGNSVLFWRAMCTLGWGLAPSNIFVQLQVRRRVVISSDLESITLQELDRLAATARRARRLETLIFEDCSWVGKLGEQRGEQSRVKVALRGFMSAPRLNRFELHGGEDVLPDWVFQEVTGVAQRHRYLEEAIIVLGQNKNTVRGEYMQCLPDAHALIRATHKGDFQAMLQVSEAPLEVHSDALALAASSGSLEILRALLLRKQGFEALHTNAGSAPHSGMDFDGDGALPLHFAAAADDGRAVQLLLLARADAESRKAGGASALHVAARNDCHRSLAVLIQHCEEQQQQRLRAQRAAAAASVSASVLLMAPGGLAFGSTEGGGAAALSNGHGSSASLLSNAGDGSSWGPAAAMEATTAAAGAGAGGGGVSAAAADGPAALVVEMRNSAGSTPLWLAAEQDSVACVRLLLAARADANAAAEQQQMATPVLAAAQRNCAESLRLLLLARGDPMRPRRDGALPMYLAAENNCVECVRALLKNGHVVANRPKNDGSTPVFAAAQKNSVESLRLLLAAGADPRKGGPGGGESGTSPVLIAAHANSPESLRLLLAAKGDANQAGKDGNTALWIAAENDFTMSVKHLLANKGDPNKAAKNGATPVLIAAEHNSSESLAHLLQARGDVHMKRHDGITPVHAAAYYGCVESLKLLLEARSDPKAEWAGQSAIQIAEEQGNRECLALLQGEAQPEHPNNNSDQNGAAHESQRLHVQEPTDEETAPMVTAEMMTSSRSSEHVADREASRRRDRFSWRSGVRIPWRR